MVNRRLNLSEKQVRFLLYILEDNAKKWELLPNDPIVQECLKTNNQVLAEIGSFETREKFKEAFDRQTASRPV